MAKFQTFTGTNGQFYFRLKSNNGETILNSEGYTTTAGRSNGIASVKSHAPYGAYYHRLTSRNGQPYFTLNSSNGQVIGTSEMYSSVASRDNGIEAVKRDAPNASIE